MPYNHIALPVIDTKSTRQFYERLGFEYLREWNKPAEELEAIVLQKENLILELVFSPRNQIQPTPDVVESRHVGIVVEDLAKLLAELQSRHINVLKPITPGVSVKEFAFITDPSGNIVELLVEN